MRDLSTTLIYLQAKMRGLGIGFNIYLYIGSYIAFFIGLGLFIRVFSLIKKKTWIEDIPRSKVRSIAMGMVEVYGVAEKYVNTLEAPYSKIECFSYTIVRKQGGVNQGKQKLGVPFYINDRTGKVLVDPWNADIRMYKAEAFYFKETVSTNSGPVYYDCWEYLILPNKTYYVLGNAGKNPHKKKSSKGHEKVMISKGDSNNPFIISSRPEKELVNLLDSGIVIGIVGGLFLIVASLIYIAWFTNML